MGHGIARVGSLLVFVVATTACGKGGGGGGGLVAGSTDWGIPFVPDTAGRAMRIHLRNLDGGTTTATLQGYLPSGTPYAGPFTVTLDGQDEHSFSASTALLGATPAGGWIRVTTLSRRVEVAFNVDEPGQPAEESARAWPLGDLAAPPPSTYAAITVNPATDFVALSNATATPVLLAVTAYDEPTIDPLLPPVSSTPPAISLAAFETKTFTPAAVSGIVGFEGALTFTGATPFFAAAREEIAFDGQPAVQAKGRLWYVPLDFGQETFSPASFEDFILLVRNDAAASRTFTIDRIHTSDGTPILATPRSILLAAHESRRITTLDPPFDDLFGDATLAPFVKVWMELSVPADVDFSYRQFDPVLGTDPMTAKAHPVGHVFETLDVFPEPVLPSAIRTFATIINPSTSPINVAITAVIPQPDGFDAGLAPLVTLTVPARGTVDFTPDGATYLNRDNAPVALIGLRFVSNSPFSVGGRRVEVNAFDVILTRSPLIRRNFDDAK